MKQNETCLNAYVALLSIAVKLEALRSDFPLYSDKSFEILEHLGYIENCFGKLTPTPAGELACFGESRRVGYRDELMQTLITTNGGLE